MGRGGGDFEGGHFFGKSQMGGGIYLAIYQWGGHFFGSADFKKARVLGKNKTKKMSYGGTYFC